MKVRVNQGVSNGRVSFAVGDIVSSDGFAALVGGGWEALCDEVAVMPPAPHAPSEPDVERAVQAPARERRGGKR